MTTTNDTVIAALKEILIVAERHQLCHTDLIYLSYEEFWNICEGMDGPEGDEFKWTYVGWLANQALKEVEK